MSLKNEIINVLKTIIDPEISINIYDLGLIYNILIDEKKNVCIEMTLTTPSCPMAHFFPSMVKNKIISAVDIDSCEVKLVWDPPWTKNRMSKIARLELDIFD
ncbi:FeS assembly SUF system protein [Candidatus Legionella polyplacis]|uniref:Iron-sulfur cluster assembly protein n=1 Tax=Candidatus Legionella polyplacis TaxID=2005262 RepID=A0ABZ2H0W1_9GAMM|nr:iron-sulfur cluster assembly protein [Candidatus Legionella polyplacis]ATW01843.1 FeS assembly SUF system protein [Candidatus Legionella polyplacis]